MKETVSDDQHYPFPWAVHIPICKEGMILRIWKAGGPKKLSKKEVNMPVELHIPFGAFLATRGDVYHAGFFGGTGNVRIHVKMVPKGWKNTKFEGGICFQQEDCPFDDVVVQDMELAGTDLEHNPKMCVEMAKRSTSAETENEHIQFPEID